jgi:hypothetical protein
MGFCGFALLTPPCDVYGLNTLSGGKIAFGKINGFTFILSKISPNRMQYVNPCILSETLC